LITCNVPNAEEKNSALLVYYEFGPSSLEEHAKLLLLSQILKEPIFTQLRTKEQIGYVVFSGVQSLGFGKQGNADYFTGFYIKILSKTLSPAEMSFRVNEFVKSNRAILSEMTQNTFQTHIDSLVMKMREPPKNLSGESSLHWVEIQENVYLWDRYEQFAQILESSVRLADMLSLFECIFLKMPVTRRLEVMVAGNHHTDSQPTSVDEWNIVPEDDIFKYKRSLYLQPAGSTPFSLCR